MEKLRSIVLLLAAFGLGGVPCVSGAMLTGTFTPIPQGDVVNLTGEGPLDWVHWGRFTQSSVDRKTGVTPQIPDFTPIGASWSGPFQFGDNFNGYSWTDGSPTPGVTNTTTGVWMYGKSKGFQLNIPIGTATNIVKIYVGTYGAAGRFDATLTNLSGTTLTYSDTSITNMSNGPGGFYTVTCAADSPGQTLLVKYVVATMFDFNTGNVTLQAAALTAPGANHPPAVSIISPAASANLSAHENLTIVANATDMDGTIARVEFFQGGTSLGESTGGSYSVTWTNVSAGKYTLTARATDDNGATVTSAPVEIFVNGTGGSLSGATALPPGNVDLTAEGTSDWAHWGLISPASFEHKAAVPQQISNFAEIGTNFSDNYTAYSWNDGTPTASANGTRTGISIHGMTNGFTLTAPADTGARTFKVYVGLYGAQGEFQAYLSDFSAPAYTDTSNSVYGNVYAVYTLNYRAASAGQNLIVKYTTKTLYDAAYGNLTLQAATFSGSAPPTNVFPTVTITSPADKTVFTAPATFTIDATAADPDGSVTQVEFFDDATSLGIDTSDPYGATAGNLTAGTHSLSAVATDNMDGKSTNSVTIIVNDAPTVSITDPADNATFSAGTDITIQADPVDSGGSVVQVQFLAGTNLLGTAASAPYVFSWRNVPASTYSLTAQATDNQDATTTSGAVSITVTNTTSVPVVLINPTVGGTILSFSFATETGPTYTVQFTDSLNPINWQVLTNFAGSGTTFTVTETAGATQRFYRVGSQ